MEAKTLKKILLYSLVAMVLGLSLVLVPLITISEATTTDYFLMPSLSNRLEKIEGKYSPDADVAFFAISFVIALVAYLLVKSIMPRRDYGSIPYRF
jgi:hypothetical protein